jgi:Bacterial regulatory proteins, luxR family
VRASLRPPATGWDSLTPTEQRVAALAAQGLTSRQIGDRLYVSTFTVGSHLRHKPTEHPGSRSPTVDDEPGVLALRLCSRRGLRGR